MSGRNGHKPPLSQAARRGTSNNRSPTLTSPGGEPPGYQSVLLGYLSGNEITKSFHKSLDALKVFDMVNTRYLHSWAEVGCGPLQIVDGRNKLCQKTLDNGCEWLFMLDSDMGFEADTLAKMMAVADPKTKPVIGGLCFSMREIGSDGMGGMDTFCAPTIMYWQEHADGISRFTGRDRYPVNQMVRCGATGAACLLIHASVLEKIGHDWFTQIPLPNGEIQGEDISFCWRLQELEIPLYVHTGIRTSHYKHLWLAEHDFWSSRISPPATEKVDVIVPALHRPQNVPRLMQSLRASTGLASATWICEPGDADEIAAVIAEGGNVLTEPGTFAHKVNWALSFTRAPWILLVGDDVRFWPGWFDQAMDVARRWDADVVGTNDLLNPRVIRGEHATHMLIRRSYIEELGSSWDGPGIVAHEGYHHWYVDDEIVMAAKFRGKFQAALASRVQHIHPLDGQTPADAIYELGEAHKEDDHATFIARLKEAVRAKIKPELVAV